MPKLKRFSAGHSTFGEVDYPSWRTTGPLRPPPPPPPPPPPKVSADSRPRLVFAPVFARSPLAPCSFYLAPPVSLPPCSVLSNLLCASGRRVCARNRLRGWESEIAGHDRELSPSCMFGCACCLSLSVSNHLPPLPSPSLPPIFSFCTPSNCCSFYGRLFFLGGCRTRAHYE